MAWGGWASKSADLSGALRTLAEQPFGKILLWLVAVGLMALALWQASEAIWGYRNHEGKRRWGMAINHYIRMISNLVLPLSLSLEGETMRSPDAKEAQRAFVEKRPPTFGMR